MRHVHHQQRAHAVGDLAETLEVDDARIGRAACDDELGAGFMGALFQRVIVDQMRVGVHRIRGHLEPLAGLVDG